MYAEIETVERNYQGPEICTVVLRTDPEAFEVIKFFVDVLTGKDQAAKTDQGSVAKR